MNSLHNEETEKAVLGCLLLSSECAKKAIGISLQAFHSLAHQGVFKAITALVRQGSGVDSITVSHKLKQVSKFEPQEGWLYYLNTIEDSVASTAMFQTYAKELAELHQRRQAIEVVERILTIANDTSIPAATIPRDLEDALEAIRNVTGLGHEEEIRKQLAVKEFNAQVQPPESRPVYQLNRITISTPGNLTAITAQAKTGKSALIGAMIAATISPATALDTLGVSSSNPNEAALLHFDTEQSPDDHWNAINRALRRANIITPPAWLKSFCFTGMSAVEIWEHIKLATADAKAQFGGVHSILIDGVADLVMDVNDPAQSNSLVSDLHHLAIENDCPVVGVIHFNPNSEKVRGHLGSQLERKSETNLILQKDGEFTCMWSAKQRRAPILKDTAPRFRWSDEAGMHVTCASANADRDADKKEAFRVQVEEVFAECPAMRYGELKSTLMNVLRVSDKTAERRISEWTKHMMVTKDLRNNYRRAA